MQTETVRRCSLPPPLFAAELRIRLGAVCSQNRSLMKLEELKAFAGAEGFRPFVIKTKVGLTMEVPHPEFVTIPPDEEASFIGVWTTARPTILRLIDLGAIDHLEFKN